MLSHQTTTCTFASEYTSKMTARNPTSEARSSRARRPHQTVQPSTRSLQYVAVSGLARAHPACWLSRRHFVNHFDLTASGAHD